MTASEDRLARLTLALLPASIVAIGFCLSLLSRGIVDEVFIILTAWLAVSLPVGVVVGHCTLSELECA